MRCWEAAWHVRRNIRHIVWRPVATREVYGQCIQSCVRRATKAHFWMFWLWVLFEGEAIAADPNLWKYPIDCIPFSFPHAEIFHKLYCPMTGALNSVSYFAIHRASALAFFFCTEYPTTGSFWKCATCSNQRFSMLEFATIRSNYVHNTAVCRRCISCMGASALRKKKYKGE